MATGGVTLKSLPSELPLDFLNKITKNFSKDLQLREDASESVYMGILDGGEVVVVKKLAENSPVPCEKKFANEVQNIMGLEHENIVKMVAYCREPNNKLVQINERYITAEITALYSAMNTYLREALTRIFLVSPVSLIGGLASK
uniref:Serine-threonine/tyrosine-protein kinase catalytic domain-containing protein n=1 Tax=Triticum urartu TaxID=4572 RepID=A0A8R7TBV2_TRIUA